jgi:hypothetical protein
MGADPQRKVRDAALGLSQPGQRLLRRACVPGRWRHGFAGLGLAHPALQRMALRKAVAAVQAHGALVLCEDLQLDRTQAGSLAALHEVLQQRRGALPRDSGTAPIVARRQRAMPGRGATSAKASTAPLAASTAARPSARSAPWRSKPGHCASASVKAGDVIGKRGRKPHVGAAGAIWSVGTTVKGWGFIGTGTDLW